jgi:agmatinase
VDERYYAPRNFGWLEPEFSNYDASRVVVLPVPYDSTTSGKAGAREGPQAIINASAYMELYDVLMDFEPWQLGIHTMPELAAHTGSPEEMTRRIESAVGDLAGDGKFVVVLGGEHSVGIGSMWAQHARHPDLSVLAIDAHSDLRDEYLDSRFNHACALRRMLDRAPVTQVGLRSASVEEARFIRDADLPFYQPRDYRRFHDGPGKVLESLREKVYITIDLDGIDPAEMAAVGTPEPGGLHWEELSALLERVASERTIVGFDVNELAPDYGPPSCAQLAAKLTYRLIGLSLLPR